MSFLFGLNEGLIEHFRIVLVLSVSAESPKSGKRRGIRRKNVFHLWEHQDWAGQSGEDCTRQTAARSEEVKAPMMGYEWRPSSLKWPYGPSCCLASPLHPPFISDVDRIKISNLDNTI